MRLLACFFVRKWITTHLPPRNLDLPWHLLAILFKNLEFLKYLISVIFSSCFLLFFISQPE
ncbi:uncharacterized protein ASCRUDRAFT_122369 [Ascoidea rubescens DSM 1968]|uniref:Uncharacterized protein n=1 Tax=Ascoidea rubescens DSM 1968 TaxID=1344418 RepID=A0A1D2V9K3_9ASCO|nr:hypothetical protein ASCRUDRAFT_122369 [Ascoidea rubescens DSM 1968]ODV58326.1 hypothetical protein ASCRUDRAFT_122369 [Ascoidea rubescens DSM 1968]